MFETLKEQPADKILMLMQAYTRGPTRRQDRPRRRRLQGRERKHADHARGQGGRTAVWETEQTKAYTGLRRRSGIRAMRWSISCWAMRCRAPTSPPPRHRAEPVPCGRASTWCVRPIRRRASSCSDPTWPNHLSILKHMGIEMVPYRYFDDATRGVDFDGMMADLGQAKEGDVVLLHGCCHNPTGANLQHGAVERGRDPAAPDRCDADDRHRLPGVR